MKRMCYSHGDSNCLQIYVTRLSEICVTFVLTMFTLLTCTQSTNNVSHSFVKYLTTNVFWYMIYVTFSVMYIRLLHVFFSSKVQIPSNLLVVIHCFEYLYCISY